MSVLIGYDGKCSKELESLFKQYPSLSKTFAIRVEALRGMGSYIITAPHFEKLKEANLYSMRLKMKRPNVRILFCFNEAMDEAVFLKVFYEKSEKSYRQAIKVALDRARRYFGEKR